MIPVWRQATLPPPGWYNMVLQAGGPPAPWVVWYSLKSGRVVVQGLVKHPQAEAPKQGEQGREADHVTDDFQPAEPAPSEGLPALGVVAKGREGSLAAEVVVVRGQLASVLLDHVEAAASGARALKAALLGLSLEAPPKVCHL